MSKKENFFTGIAAGTLFILTIIDDVLSYVVVGFLFGVVVGFIVAKKLTKVTKEQAHEWIEEYYMEKASRGLE